MDDSAGDKKDVTPVKCTPRALQTTAKPKVLKPAPIVILPKQYGPGKYAVIMEKISLVFLVTSSSEPSSSSFKRLPNIQ
jgi:hypothetical protein